MLQNFRTMACLLPFSEMLRFQNVDHFADRTLKNHRTHIEHNKLQKNFAYKPTQKIVRI